MGIEVLFYHEINVKRNLSTIYKDLFVKGNKDYIKDYLNSYSFKNKIKSFKTVNDIVDNYDDIINGRKASHIRYDHDVVMVCNVKRYKKEKLSKEEDEEIKGFMKVYRNEGVNDEVIERCVINIE